MLASDVVRAVSRPPPRVLLLTGTAEVWMLAVLAFVYGTAAALFMPALIGLIPQTVEPGAPAGGQRAAGADAQHRERGRPGDRRRAGRRRRPGEAIAVDAATFAFSALCLARMRVGAEAGAAARRGRAVPRRAARRLARGALARLAALGPDRDERLPRVRAAGGVRARPGARRATSSTAPRAGPPSSPASGSAASWATCWRCASRCAGRSFIAALALVGASTQAAIIGCGLGTVGIAALELLAGVCVALFFTLWDLSSRSRSRATRVSRVSAYDFSVSMGLMPLGMAVCRPDRRRHRPAGRRCWA